MLVGIGYRLGCATMVRRAGGRPTGMGWCWLQVGLCVRRREGRLQADWCWLPVGLCVRRWEGQRQAD